MPTSVPGVGLPRVGAASSGIRRSRLVGERSRRPRGQPASVRPRPLARWPPTRPERWCAPSATHRQVRRRRPGTGSRWCVATGRCSWAGRPGRWRTSGSRPWPSQARTSPWPWTGRHRPRSGWTRGRRRPVRPRAPSPPDPPGAGRALRRCCRRDVPGAGVRAGDSRPGGWSTDAIRRSGPGGPHGSWTPDRPGIGGRSAAQTWGRATLVDRRDPGRPASVEWSGHRTANAPRTARPGRAPVRCRASDERRGPAWSRAPADGWNRPDESC